MFDRFTDRAKKSLNLARQTAQEFGHPYLAPEHMLCGVLSAGESGASRILAASKVTAADVLAGLKRRMPPPDKTSTGQLPFTVQAKRALEQAMEAARDAGHSWIGTEHLLVGLSECGSDLVTALLREHGLGAGELRHGLPDSDGPPKNAPERKLTLDWAAEIARQMGDEETARRIEALIQRIER